MWCGECRRAVRVEGSYFIAGEYCGEQARGHEAGDEEIFAGRAG